MGSSDSYHHLPDAQSPDLELAHPTAKERVFIWRLISLAWKDALTLPLFIEESEFLTSVPLAADGGMTLWILVERSLPPDHRPILCSCETFRKRALINDQEGIVSESLIHGVASVFCNPAYRRRGYAARMMIELAETLRTWQTGATKCIGSVLYSDIGKTYYAKFGWHPLPNNNHIEFDPLAATEPLKAIPLMPTDLEELCKQDEQMIRKEMISASDGRTRVMIVPGLDHMLWHHKKEEFVCDKLFKKQPVIKGAIAGPPGNRVWAIWTRRFYGAPKLAASGNTLYILRLVLENPAAGIGLQSGGLQDDDIDSQTQAEYLKAVLQRAQAEAVEWNLNHISLWDPTPLTQSLIERTGIQYRNVKRDHEGIASLLWYGKGSGKEEMLEWLGNEKYAWC